MSKTLTLKEFKARLPKEIAEEIEIISFSGSSKPLTFRIKSMNEIRTISQARKLEKFKLHSMAKWGSRLPNSNKGNFQAKVDKLFGKDTLAILEYNGCNQKCLVKCLKCGDVRELATPEAIVKGNYPCHCYYIEDDRAAVQRDIDHLFGDGEYTVIRYKKRSDKIMIRHKCGFIFEKATFYTLQNMRGCPQCFKAISKGEQEVSKNLLKMKVPFEAQYTFSDLRGARYPLRFDFAVKHEDKVFLIEFDGEGHYQSKESFGGEEGYQTTLKHDTLKNEYCQKHEIPLLRIPYWDFKHIKKLILEFLRFNDYPLGEYTSSEVETLNSEREDIV